jgi:XRE family transcriptional regulator, regulator of sulfur utilization
MSALSSILSLEPRRARVLEQTAVGTWVRRLRTEQGEALRSLAARAGLSMSFVSQVENGVVSPSVASLEKICHALGATLADCFAAASEAEGGLIVRRTERVQISAAWSQAQVEALAPATGSRLGPLLVTLDPGGSSTHEPCHHSAEEFIFVLMGRPTLTLGPEEHELNASDAVTIRARERRRWENRTSSVVKILCVSAS